MPEYELGLRFTAADGLQASRLAAAWACTCAAEYGTRYAGFRLIEPPSRQDKLDQAVRDRFDPRFLTDPYCDWCGTAIFPDFERNWHDRHGDFRCEANDEDRTHEPAAGDPSPPVPNGD